MGEHEDTKFVIDLFRQVASHMADKEHRIIRLENEVKRLNEYAKGNAERIKVLEGFVNGLRVVMKPPEPE